jgi:hypothetical protein
LVITANDNLVDGGWSCDPERSGSRCHMARETGVKAGNEEQGIGIKKSNFKRNPENKEYSLPKKMVPSSGDGESAFPSEGHHLYQLTHMLHVAPSTVLGRFRPFVA